MRRSMSLAVSLCLLVAAAPASAVDLLPVYQIEMVWRAEDGRYSEALVLAAKVLRMTSQRGDTAQIAVAHHNLSRLLLRVGRPDSARAHAVAAANLSSSSGSLLVLAEVLGAQGKADSALALLQAAAKAGIANRDSVEAGLALSAIGAGLLSRGHPAEALARLDSAVALLATTDEAVARGLAHAYRGRCLFRLRSHERACDEFELAYRFLTEDRAHKLTDRARLGVMERASDDFFEEWRDAWLARGTSISFQYRALGVVERSRGQALLDFVHPVDTMITDTTGYMHRVLSPGRRFGPGRELVDDVRGAIEGSIPPDAALLYYSQSPDSLVIWIYRDRKLYTVKTYYPARLYERLKDFVGAISDASMAPGGISDWWQRYMATHGGPETTYGLFSKACFPDTLLSFIKGASELIIVPDGWLWRLPFAAMPVGGTPLGLRLPLRYAPSLAMLEHIEQRPRSQAPIRTGETLFLGDPLLDLPGAQVEARAAAGMFGSRPVLGAAATESLATAKWPGLRLVHLATHGEAYANPDSALEAHVVLAPSSGFDGRLTAREVYDVLPSGSIHLLFLSACKSSFGALTRTDGTIGLPRAFLANGVRTVVAGMWYLPDSSTSYLVQRFYHHLRSPDRLTVAQAMHRAMVETGQQPGWSNPLFWAAFQVIGGY